MRLTAFVVDGHRLNIRPAAVERLWMDRTDQRFAYRCLPLAIANAHGWEILCPSGFTASWDGRPVLDAVVVVPDGDNPEGAPISHFGSGILTFHVPCVFRTEPGIDLWVQAPVNRPKDAISGLTGVIETDWAPYTFTMNWQFTRTHAPVRFEAGEPFCHLFPVKRADLEGTRPELRPLSDDPALEGQHRLWSEGRSEFNRQLREPNSTAAKARWQKLYQRGLNPDGKARAPEHRTRLRVRPFTQIDVEGEPST